MSLRTPRTDIVPLTLVRDTPPLHGQNGVDLSFSPCFACQHMGTLLSNPSFYWHLGHTKRGVTITFFVLFSQHLGILGPPNAAKRGNKQNDKSTLFYPFRTSPFKEAWIDLRRLQSSRKKGLYWFFLALRGEGEVCCAHLECETFRPIFTGPNFQNTPTPHPWKSLLGVGGYNLGACAMTTEFLDNNMCTFKILLSGRFPRKLRCGSLPAMPPPLKNADFIYFVVSLSLRIMKGEAHPKKHPNKNSLRKRVGSNLFKMSALLPVKQSENRRKLFVQTVCVWVVFWVSWGA